MKLYYTNSQTTGTIQASALESLGGFISNSPVPNDTLNNLFDSLSDYSKQQKQSQYRVIALKNETEEVKTNLKVWVVYEDQNPDVEILLSASLPNASGKLEKLPSVFSRPFNIPEFFETSEDSKLLLSESFPAGSSIGVWIQRNIKDFDPIFDQTIDPKAVKEKINSLKKEEKFSIFFEWD